MPVGKQLCEEIDTAQEHLRLWRGMSTYRRELVESLLVDAHRVLTEQREILTRGQVAALARGVQTMQETAANISVPAPCTAPL
jgi:hypothetical protein